MRHYGGGYRQKHQRKSGTDAAGDVQRIGDQISARTNESFAEQPQGTADGPEDHAAKMYFFHFDLPFHPLYNKKQLCLTEKRKHDQTQL